MQPSGKDASDLRDLNENYIRSVAQFDVGWFDRNLSEDFLNTNPDGTLVDRRGFLAQIAKGAAISGLRCEDVRIRTFGDTAIIHARTVYGQPGAGRYTDIWNRQDGRWLCVAAHVTRG